MTENSRSLTHAGANPVHPFFSAAHPVVLRAFMTLLGRFTLGPGDLRFAEPIMGCVIGHGLPSQIENGVIPLRLARPGQVGCPTAFHSLPPYQPAERFLQYFGSRQRCERLP